MSERVKFISHKGKKLLFVNYKDLHGPEYLETIQESMRVVLTCGETDLCVLIDLTGSVLDKTATEAQKEVVQKVNKLARRVAVMGVTGVKKILADFIVRFGGIPTRFVNTMDEGKEWLTAL